MQIAGSTFMVTGAASGLGAGSARMFAAAGGNVVAADLNLAQGEALARELGSRACFVRVDVSDESDVRAAVRTAVERFGRLDGLVNCAGIVIGERVLGRDGPHALQAFAKVIQVNLIGTFNAIRLAADAMAKNPPAESGERGVIVNTASVAAFEGQIGQAAYSASKSGVAGMTLPMKESLAAQVPFPSRLGRADEYAALVRHIVENQMLNAATIRLDGAIRMAPK
jgi:NAD(P)-dependent dehydrogenase (short-subunit alcohol dehydrogenase family)